MKGLKEKLPRIPAVALWIAATALLTLGLVTTLLDLTKVPAAEAGRAATERQRFLANPVTGDILMSAPDAAATANLSEGKKPAESFDVGTKEEAAAGEEPPAEEHPEEAPVEEAPPSTMPSLRTTPVTAALEAPPHTKDSLVSAPAREVTETVGTVRLPKRGDKGVTPATLYAHPFKRQPEHVPISFVITEVGLDPQSVAAILALPREVTLAYSPYTKKETSYSEHLRALGYEVWLMLPTMTDRYPSDDPGPLGLVAQMPAEEISRRLLEILAAVPGSVGVVLPSNDALGATKDAVTPILKEVDARGLLALMAHPTRAREQVTSDKELRAMLARADLVLDPEPNEPQIRSRLAGLLEAAKEKSEYVVVLSARPQSVQILGDWLKENPLPEPFVLAPLSAIAQPKPAVVEAAPKEEGGGHGGGHGGGEEKKKEKKKPKEKPKKPLPQDQYLKPAGEKEGGGHGGGH